MEVGLIGALVPVRGLVVVELKASQGLALIPNQSMGAMSVLGVGIHPRPATPTLVHVS